MNNNTFIQESLSFSVNSTEGRKILDCATLLKADITYFKNHLYILNKIKNMELMCFNLALTQKLFSCSTLALAYFENDTLLTGNFNHLTFLHRFISSLLAWNKATCFSLRHYSAKLISEVKILRTSVLYWWVQNAHFHLS